MADPGNTGGGAAVLVQCPGCNDGPEGDPLCAYCDGTGRIPESMLSDYLTHEDPDA